MEKKKRGKYSISKRKYLIDDILKPYIPPPVNGIADNIDADGQSDKTSSYDEGRIEEM